MRNSVFGPWWSQLMPVQSINCQFNWPIFLIWKKGTFWCLNTCTKWPVGFIDCTWFHILIPEHETDIYDQLNGKNGISYFISLSQVVSKVNLSASSGIFRSKRMLLPCMITYYSYDAQGSPVAIMIWIGNPLWLTSYTV